MADSLPPGPGRRGPKFHAERGGIVGRDEIRTFSEQTGKPRKSRDSHETSLKLKALAWSPAGIILGLAAGVALVSMYGFPVWVLLPCAALGFCVVYFGPQIITHMGGKAAGSLYNPSGRTTPHAKEYSYEESLVARGLYEEAATAYELAALENPGDATPVIRLARILRDHLERYEDAARWFKRVPNAGAKAGQTFLARKELVELYWHRMGQPQKAAPDLARMAEELEGTPEGEWAAEELREVKRIIAEQQEPA